MIDYSILFVVLFPLVMGAVGYLLSKKLPKMRELFFIGSVLIEMCVIAWMLIYVFSGNEIAFAIGGNGFELSFKADCFRVLYSAISVFLWLMTIIFSKEYMHHYENKDRYYLFYLITLAGVVGVFLSDDFFTTFCFFEIMSFASYPLVIHEENNSAMSAGETYLGVAVISGMALLVGLFFIANDAGSLRFDELRVFYAHNEITTMSFIGGVLILLGFGAKAGMYPLHIWLPKAHPVAPAPASALLSGILTKTGVFGIIVISADVFAGNAVFAKILLALAVITMFWGAFLALFSVNLKRTLACSSMSQIGFILVGVAFAMLLGEEGGIAQNGALLHMTNHSLIKLVLFMAAGVVAMNIHQLNLNEIKGFGRKKPFLAVVFLLGAVGIMGIPLFNGYVSKTLIHESIVEYINVSGLVGFEAVVFKAIEWIFLLSGGLTVAYMTKLFICIFVEKNNAPEKQKEFDGKKKYLSLTSKIVLVLSVIPMLIIGFLPNFVCKNVISTAFEFFGVERFTESVEFFGWESLKGALISIVIGAVVYVFVVRKLLVKDNRYVNLKKPIIDLENDFYRPVICSGTLLLIKYVVGVIAAAFEYIIIDGTVWFILYPVRFFAICFDKLMLILNKTVLKNNVYHFKEESVADKIGRTVEKLSRSKSKHEFSEKFDSFSRTLSSKIYLAYNSFSFAFTMISIGIIIVLLFALLH